MAKQQKVFDCDLFVTNDFTFDGVVRISGNLFASANVWVDALDVGGDIYLISPDPDDPICIDAIDIECSNFYSYNVEQAICSLCVHENFFIEFYGPVKFEA